MHRRCPCVLLRTDAASHDACDCVSRPRSTIPRLPGARRDAQTGLMLQVKRVYEPPSSADGFRVLVDRLWPRGLSKERAHVDLWDKDVAPSAALRTAFHHEALPWDVF